MADVVLFHHVIGLTDGVRQFADELSGRRHRVHTPDLYDGQVADSLESGFAIRNSIGDETIDARIEAALSVIEGEVVYAGMSIGVMTAQQLAQTRPEAVGALLYESCVPLTGEWAFGPWPNGVRVQIHGMDDDEFFAHEGDLAAARLLVESVGSAKAEIFTYPGDRHLFMDNSLPTYDADATRLVVERSQALLDAVS
jgi:dienelactone hydrolase